MDFGIANRNYFTARITQFLVVRDGRPAPSDLQLWLLPVTLTVATECEAGDLMPTKRVTVHYRRAVDRNLADLDFRGCFDGALASQINGVTLGNLDSARITTSADDRRMCLLSPESNPNFCFGEIAVFKEGDVPIAETDPQGQVHLRTILLQGNEEAIRGSSYFMATGPHVAILHHDSSTRFVDDYLRWLFRQPIGPLAQDEIVSLQPLISVGGRPVALRAVKSLTIRAEVEQLARVASFDGGRVDGRPQTFARMIDRHVLTPGNMRNILHELGLTNGSLNRLQGNDFDDLEFELLVKKRDGNTLVPLPQTLIEGVMNDGLDRAAEFETEGVRRRGDTIVASFPGQIETDGTYYDLNTVRTVLWGALSSWTVQGLI